MNPTEEREIFSMLYEMISLEIIFWRYEIMKKLIGGVAIITCMACAWVGGYVAGFKQCVLDVGNNWPLPDDMECDPIEHRLGFVKVIISKEKVEH